MMAAIALREGLTWIDFVRQFLIFLALSTPSVLMWRYERRTRRKIARLQQYKSSNAKFGSDELSGPEGAK